MKANLPWSLHAYGQIKLSHIILVDLEKQIHLQTLTIQYTMAVTMTAHYLDPACDAAGRFSRLGSERLIECCVTFGKVRPAVDGKCQKNCKCILVRSTRSFSALSRICRRRLSFQSERSDRLQHRVRCQSLIGRLDRVSDHWQSTSLLLRVPKGAI